MGDGEDFVAEGTDEESVEGGDVASHDDEVEETMDYDDDYGTEEVLKTRDRQALQEGDSTVEEPFVERDASLASNDFTTDQERRDHLLRRAPPPIPAREKPSTRQARRTEEIEDDDGSEEWVDLPKSASRRPVCKIHNTFQ